MGPLTPQERRFLARLATEPDLDVPAVWRECGCPGSGGSDQAIHAAATRLQNRPDGLAAMDIARQRQDVLTRHLIREDVESGLTNAQLGSATTEEALLTLNAALRKLQGVIAGDGKWSPTAVATLCKTALETCRDAQAGAGLTDAQAEAILRRVQDGDKTRAKILARESEPPEAEEPEPAAPAPEPLPAKLRLPPNMQTIGRS